MPHLVSFGVSFAATVTFLSDAFDCYRPTVSLDSLCKGKIGGRLLEVTMVVEASKRELKTQYGISLMQKHSLS